MTRDAGLARSFCGQIRLLSEINLRPAAQRDSLQQSLGEHREKPRKQKGLRENRGAADVRRTYQRRGAVALESIDE
jgi:hypothetical protein